MSNTHFYDSSEAEFRNWDNQTVGKAKIPALTEVGMDPGPMEIVTMLP